MGIKIKLTRIRDEQGVLLGTVIWRSDGYQFYQTKLCGPLNADYMREVVGLMDYFNNCYDFG